MRLKPTCFPHCRGENFHVLTIPNNARNSTDLSRYVQSCPFLTYPDLSLSLALSLFVCSFVNFLFFELQKWGLKTEDYLEYENDLNYEYKDDVKYEDDQDHKYKDDLKYEDNLKY